MTELYLDKEIETLSYHLCEFGGYKKNLNPYIKHWVETLLKEREKEAVKTYMKWDYSTECGMSLTDEEAEVWCKGYLKSNNLEG